MDYCLYSETLLNLGLQTLTERRQKLTLYFAQRSLADNKLGDLFPIRKKRHGMNTRNSEHFRVTKQIQTGTTIPQYQQFYNNARYAEQQIRKKPFLTCRCAVITLNACLYHLINPLSLTTL